MSQFLKRHSKPLRYDIAKICMKISRFIAPRVVRDLASFPRPFEMFVRSQNKSGLIGCEIGVAEGVHAESMMTTIKPDKLFLIDPYDSYSEDGKIFDRSSSEVKAKKRLKKFGDRVVFIKKTSASAIKNMPIIDFVYIDGNHEKSFVMSDLRLYYSRLREGGIIGGHDFGGCYVGLIQAVIKFAEEKRLLLHGDITDFWMIKGETI